MVPLLVMTALPALALLQKHMVPAFEMVALPAALVSSNVSRLAAPLTMVTPFVTPELSISSEPPAPLTTMVCVAADWLAIPLPVTRKLSVMESV